MYALVLIFLFADEPVVYVKDVYDTEAKCHQNAIVAAPVPYIHFCLPEEIFGEKA